MSKVAFWIILKLKVINSLENSSSLLLFAVFSSDYNETELPDRDRIMQKFFSKALAKKHKAFR